LYVPVPHGEHVPPLAPEYPALHWQAVLEVLPAGATESTQAEQAAGPAPALYWSTPHCEHVSPFAPV